MKKFAILACAMLAATSGALALSADKPQKIQAAGADAHHPVLSPDASMLLYTGLDHTGLKAMNIANGLVRTIDTDAAAGFQPVFSADSRTVFYRTASLVDGLTNRDLRSYDLGNNVRETLEPMSRRDLDINAKAGNTDYAVADWRTINVVKDGKLRAVSPLENAHSYLWASLSPDGTKMVFVEPYMGVFISNADGTGAQKVADRGDFPAWADNNTVVYVLSEDDGYVVLSSELKAYELDSRSTSTLDTDGLKVSESTAANGTVVFSGIEGGLYRISLTK